MKVEIKQSISILDSEELVEKTYTGLLGLMSLFPKEGDMTGLVIGAKNAKSLDFLVPITNGLYIPASKRLFWAGRFDTNVDELPKAGAVYITRVPGYFEWASFKKINTLPSGLVRGVNPKMFVAHYQIALSFFGKPCMVRDVNHDVVETRVSFFSIKKDGTIYPHVNVAYQKAGFMDDEAVERAVYWGSGAINLIADSKYLWTIEAYEKFTWQSSAIIPAKVIFGSEEEMVKSLFYARQAPLTAAGRKRPILHWVKAHKRRLEKGIDVDIRKHMRGITEFHMGDLPFRITSPIK